MEKENEDVQEVDLEQEEEISADEETVDDNVITVSKDKFKAMQRKAMAYDASKKAPIKKEVITNTENSQSNEKFERLELKVDGYPDNVIDEILKLGGKKALSNPLIKKVADDLVEQYKAEKATSIDTTGGSDIDKKYSQADLESMSLADLEKTLPHAGE